MAFKPALFTALALSSFAVMGSAPAWSAISDQVLVGPPGPEQAVTLETRRDRANEIILARGPDRDYRRLQRPNQSGPRCSNPSICWNPAHNPNAGRRGGDSGGTRSGAGGGRSSGGTCQHVATATTSNCTIRTFDCGGITLNMRRCKK